MEDFFISFAISLVLHIILIAAALLIVGLLQGYGMVTGWYNIDSVTIGTVVRWWARLMPVTVPVTTIVVSAFLTPPAPKP